MSGTYFATAALLPDGWHHHVRIRVDDRGIIESVTSGATADDAECLKGPVIPGMPNLHSHAFQRAMAGLAEVGSAKPDSFWSWRDNMYALVDRLTPDQTAVIARALYVEMLKGGYTQVSEFHYLHHAPSGQPYTGSQAMSEALLEASASSGIGMTLLPVLYAHSDFGGKPATQGQRRFVHTVDGYLRLLDELKTRCQADSRHTLGMAVHSLRAVTPEEIAEVLAANPAGPRHIHVAEQQKEVQASLAWSGQRPVQWLLDNVDIDERWCLIHATHLDDSEVRGLADSRAVAGLCPTTEANLGDGLFRGEEYAAQQGRWGIGSDSQVSVNVVEELRLLEYGQRLKTQRRNVLQSAQQRGVGDWLYTQAVAGGAQASGQPIGALAPGKRADWIVLDGEDPYLASANDDSRMGRWLFAGTQAQIRDVMVAGVWQIEDGHHAMDEENRRALRDVLQALQHRD